MDVVGGEMQLDILPCLVQFLKENLNLATLIFGAHSWSILSGVQNGLPEAIGALMQALRGNATLRDLLFCILE